MKNTKTYLILILAGTVIFSLGLWFYSTKEALGIFEIAVGLMVAIVVGFSIFLGQRRLKDEKKGIPVDDEFSKLIKQKAESKAFAYSFYLWTLIIMFSVDREVRPEIPMGIGILGMGLIFIFLWIYYSKQGLKDDQ